jgi:hypothetical protein
MLFGVYIVEKCMLKLLKRNRQQKDWCDGLGPSHPRQHACSSTQPSSRYTVCESSTAWFPTPQAAIDASATSVSLVLCPPPLSSPHLLAASPLPPTQQPWRPSPPYSPTTSTRVEAGRPPWRCNPFLIHPHPSDVGHGQSHRSVRCGPQSWTIHRVH